MKELVKTNIFIAHTPLQNFIAQKIVEQNFPSANYTNILYTSVSMEADGTFCEYNHIDKFDFFKKITNTLKAKREISKTLKQNACSVFIPHTGALLDNYLFYSFAKEKYEVEINFYYEGILYFYNYEEPFKRKTHFSRKLMGYLAGFDYKIRPGIFPADNPRIHKIYSILPQFTLGPKDKIIKVSIAKENYISKKNCILIMGGKPSLLENNEVIALYEQMIQKIGSYGPNVKVYFKGHHSDISNNFDLANKNQIQVEDITQNKPIEEVIELYKPCLILSYPSSGLVNLKAMYADKIEVFSYYMETKKNHLAKLWPIFEDLHIHLELI